MKNKGYEIRKTKRLAFFIKTAKKFGVLVYIKGKPAAAAYKLTIEKSNSLEKIFLKKGIIRQPER